MDQPVPANVLPMPHMPKIDSDVAIHSAIRSRSDVGRGRTGEHGYGFIVHVHMRGRKIIAVMGSYRDHPAQVDVDGGSGRVLGALIYGFPSTVAYSQNGGQRWQKSNLHGGFVAGITAVPGSLGAAYAVETGTRAIRLWKTGDGGCSWTPASVLPQRPPRQVNRSSLRSPSYRRFCQ